MNISVCLHVCLSGCLSDFSSTPHGLMLSPNIFKDHLHIKQGKKVCGLEHKCL